MAIVNSGPQFIENASAPRHFLSHVHADYLPPAPRVWSVILAGGEGDRVRPLIERWLGRHLPKQYCTFTGTRSLFQHTLDRAQKITPGERILVVINRTHRQFMREQLAGRSFIQVIEQPCNRDTAPGIFLPLTYIRLVDPQASVIFYPSDHFIFPEEQYIESLRQAAAESARLNRVVLLGVSPDKPEREYGWIYPGPVIDCDCPGLRSVRSFVEKPSLPEANAAMKAGALWNSFVLIGPVEKFWDMGWDYLPDLMSQFETLTFAIQSGRQTDVIDSMYRRMPARNFSSEVLQRASEKIAVAKLDDVLWSDWGSPGRIVQTLGRVHLQPAFPSMLSLQSEPFSR